MSRIRQIRCKGQTNVVPTLKQSSCLSYLLSSYLPVDAIGCAVPMASDLSDVAPVSVLVFTGWREVLPGMPISLCLPAEAFRTPMFFHARSQLRRPGDRDMNMSHGLSYGSLRFSMLWQQIRRQREHRPRVYFFHDHACSLTPYLPQGSVKPHLRQRTTQPGARRSYSASLCSSVCPAMMVFLVHNAVKHLTPNFAKRIWATR